MTMPDGSFGTPYSLSEAKAVAEHRQSAYWDEYHRHLYEWLISEVVRLRSDEWLAKAAEEIALSPDCSDRESREYAASATMAILRKHRDGLK